MSKRDSHELLIEDIIECGDKIMRYTLDMGYEDFVSNDLVLDAVIRNFEIIGEAANRLSDDFKDLNPEIEWHRIRGFRNRIVHDYAGIDTSIVWGIITEFLPSLLIQLKKL